MSSEVPAENNLGSNMENVDGVYIQQQSISTSNPNQKYKHPGDWECPSCSHHNYASRAQCQKCSTPRSAVTGGKGGKHPGDWVCHYCNELNFASRVMCRKCSTSRGVRPMTAAQKKKIQNTGAMIVQLGTNPGNRTSAWFCSSCNDYNSISRPTCKKCGALRYYMVPVLSMSSPSYAVSAQYQPLPITANTFSKGMVNPMQQQIVSAGTRPLSTGPTLSVSDSARASEDVAQTPYMLSTINGFQALSLQSGAAPSAMYLPPKIGRQQSGWICAHCGDRNYPNHRICRQCGRGKPSGDVEVTLQHLQHNQSS